MTDERRPYEAPDVREVPGNPCPSCGVTVFRGPGDDFVHFDPVCEQWAADHPAEPAPEAPDGG